MRIPVSPAEVESRCLSQEHAAAAARHLRETGAVILENAVDLELLADVRAAHAELTRDGRKLKAPPLERPFCDPGIVANPFVLPVLQAVLGDKVALALYLLHQVDPGKASEGDVHRDGNHLFPELGAVLPPSGLFLDIPLGDFTEENGATRIWPSSHHILDVPPGDVRHLAERARHLPAVQMTMPAGSLFLRDMRLWHGAMPNATGESRIMLDIAYMRVLPHAHERLPLSDDVKQAFPPAARKLLRTA